MRFTGNLTQRKYEGEVIPLNFIYRQRTFLIGYCVKASKQFVMVTPISTIISKAFKLITSIQYNKRGFMYSIAFLIIDNCFEV